MVDKERFIYKHTSPELKKLRVSEREEGGGGGGGGGVRAKERVSGGGKRGGGTHGHAIRQGNKCSKLHFFLLTAIKVFHLFRVEDWGSVSSRRGEGIRIVFTVDLHL